MYSILLLAVAVKPACDYIIKKITKNILSESEKNRSIAYDELAKKLSTNDDQTLSEAKVMVRFATVTNKKLENFAEQLSSASNNLSGSRKEIYNVESSLTYLLKLAEKLNEQADNNIKTLESSTTVLMEIADKLSKQTNDLSNSRKEIYDTTEKLEFMNKQSHLPSSNEFIRAIELDGAKEVQLLCKDVAEVRKLVLEHFRKTLENIDQVKANIGEHTNNVKIHIDDRIEKIGKQMMDSRTAGQLDASNIRNTLFENRTAAHADAISLHNEHVQMNNKSSRTASLI